MYCGTNCAVAHVYDDLFILVSDFFTNKAMEAKFGHGIPFVKDAKLRHLINLIADL